jgi:hypothetical protein
MDCESCGRYRPSAEITAMLDPAGRLVMICVRCRRVATGRPTTRTTSPTLVSVPRSS